MNYRFVWIALFNDAAAAALLLQGLSGPGRISAFLAAHAIAVWYAYAFFGAVFATHGDTRRIVGKSLFVPVLLLDCVPVVGPAGVLLFSLILLLYPVRALATEEYETVDSALVENMARGEETMLLLKANPIYIIHNRLEPREALDILRILDRIGWFPFKTRILQLFLEHATHPSVTLEAGRMIGGKRDRLLTRIAEIEETDDPGRHLKLASLYHELYHLALSGPLIGDTYLRLACDHANAAVRESPDAPDALLAATLYHLKACRYDVAAAYLERAVPVVAPDSAEYRALERFAAEMAMVREIEQGRLTSLPEGPRA